jgi:hypothetical protein
VRNSRARLEFRKRRKHAHLDVAGADKAVMPLQRVVHLLRGAELHVGHALGGGGGRWVRRWH